MSDERKNAKPWYAGEYRAQPAYEQEKDVPQEESEEDEFDEDEYYYSFEELDELSTAPDAEEPEESYADLSPQEIKAELEKYVIGQEEACRQTALMMYQHLHGHRSVALIAGPTGSGKSFITESLENIFPDIIHLQEVSNLTNDGWSGSKKVNSLFQDIKWDGGENSRGPAPILVLDECDKLFQPKYSRSENVSATVQAELLAVIHGGKITVQDRVIDTRQMSFLFAGAFEKQAETAAQKESGKSFGFGASHEKISAYHRDITIDDIREAGCIAELCGRIGKVINLHKFEEGQFRKMLDNRECGLLHELEQEFQIRLQLSEKKKEEIAHNAFQSGLGMRGIKHELRRYIDEAIWNDCKTKLVEVC